MTIRMYHELSCDRLGCSAVYGASPDELGSAAATLAGGRAEGWRREKGEDFCPEHAKAGAQR